jgi:hypothetical protein
MNRWVVVSAALTATLMTGCRDSPRTPARAFNWIAPGDHQALATSFVHPDSASLLRLLHPDFVVQPPAPDSALQGAAAIAYVLQLAASTSVDESRLVPMTITPEGPFAFERGFWQMRVGGRALRALYALRWRNTDDGWKVVLWRWEAFR